MLVHDYPVKRRTYDELDRLAETLRKEWQVPEGSKLNVIELLFTKMPERLKTFGLKLSPRAGGYMGELEACAYPDRKKIFFRERLLARLRFGDFDAGLVILHELVHVLIHPGAQKAWVVSGNDKSSFIEEECSAEWQATTLALCLLAPTKSAQDCRSSDEFHLKLGIPKRYAEQHFEIANRRSKRKVPDVYKMVRRELVGTRNENKRGSQDQLILDADIVGSEYCTRCGYRTLLQVGSKYRCRRCAQAGDLFQDGDLVGIEF